MCEKWRTVSKSGFSKHMPKFYTIWKRNTTVAVFKESFRCESYDITMCRRAIAFYDGVSVSLWHPCTLFFCDTLLVCLFTPSPTVNNNNKTQQPSLWLIIRLMTVMPTVHLINYSQELWLIRTTLIAIHTTESLLLDI